MRIVVVGLIDISGTPPLKYNVARALVKYNVAHRENGGITISSSERNQCADTAGKR